MSSDREDILNAIEERLKTVPGIKTVVPGRPRSIQQDATCCYWYSGAEDWQQTLGDIGASTKFTIAVFWSLSPSEISRQRILDVWQVGDDLGSVFWQGDSLDGLVDNINPGTVEAGLTETVSGVVYEMTRMVIAVNQFEQTVIAR